MKLENNRAGQLKRMQSDYECFVPHNLKDIKLNIDSEINALINKAYLLLGRLDGMAITIVAQLSRQKSKIFIMN